MKFFVGLASIHYVRLHFHRLGTALIFEFNYLLARSKERRDCRESTRGWQGKKERHREDIPSFLSFFE